MIQKIILTFSFFPVLASTSTLVKCEPLRAIQEFQKAGAEWSTKHHCKSFVSFRCCHQKISASYDKIIKYDSL